MKNPSNSDVIYFIYVSQLENWTKILNFHTTNLINFSSWIIISEGIPGTALSRDVNTTRSCDCHWIIVEIISYVSWLLVTCSLRSTNSLAWPSAWVHSGLLCPVYSVSAQVWHLQPEIGEHLARPSFCPVRSHFQNFYFPSLIYARYTQAVVSRSNTNGLKSTMESALWVWRIMHRKPLVMLSLLSSLSLAPNSNRWVNNKVLFNNS